MSVPESLWIFDPSLTIKHNTPRVEMVAENPEFPQQMLEASVLLDISSSFQDYRVRRNDVWYGYTDGDHWGAIPFVSHLFRGQNQRYSPMLPSIVRGLTTRAAELRDMAPDDLARIILRLAQSWWFARELDYHPIADHAAVQKLLLNRIGLAQHYGISTGYLDLTDDFDVAGFFAACRETSNGWEPLDEGTGVLYRIELKSLDNVFGSYDPLGPQVLPRPAEQCAWVTEVPIDCSFEDWPDVQMLEFNQQKYVGEYFLRKFDGGKALFPPDPLADVAREILACEEIPTVLIERAMQSFAEDPLGIDAKQVADVKDALSKIISFVEYRRLLTADRVASLRADFEWRKKMLSDVKVRWPMVRDEPADG